VHGEGGQATVEWVALVLAAALVLGAAAALAGREADPALGEAVAKRITGAARAVGRAPAGAAGTSPADALARSAPPGGGAPGAAPLGAGPPDARPPAAAPPGPGDPAPVAPTRSASSPLAALPRAVGFGGALAGIGRVAKHGWIVCVGYERWRHELESPSAPTEPLPVDTALSIVNTCFNPHDYLLED
jgi:hypothetical protein